MDETRLGVRAAPGTSPAHGSCSQPSTSSAGQTDSVAPDSRDAGLLPDPRNHIDTGRDSELQLRSPPLGQALPPRLQRLCAYALADRADRDQ